MASKRRQRRRSCDRKQRHATRGSAVASIRAARRARGHRDWLNAYKCDHCGGWHVGHPPRSVRQSIIARQRNAA